MSAGTIGAAPQLEVSAWLNGPVDPAGLAGKVVAVHAFQMLCPACVAHGLPQAQKIRATFAPRDVAVLGLHTVFEHHEAMGPAALRAFLHEYRIGFPVGIDQPADDGPVPATMRRYGMRGTPTLLLFDRRGALREHIFGAADDMRVGALIAALVNEDAAGCSEAGCLIPAQEHAR